MAKQVVGLFASMQDARNAIQELRNAGFTDADISLVARNTTTTGTADSGDTRAEEDAAFGATSGALMGGLGGLLVGLGALAIPGVGPVIAGGTLASALGSAAVGAGVGAASGGLIGALVGSGIPDEDANIYAEGVRRGGALVTVQARDTEMANRASDILDRYNVQDIDRLGSDFRSSGWSRFDESAGEWNEGSGVGTGIGTLAGAATGAALGSAGGPVGTVVGGVAGAVTGAGIGAAGDRLGAAADDTAYTGTTTDYNQRTAGTTNYDTTTDYNQRTTGTTNYDTTQREGEMRIPVVEEEINVQKREVERGGVRVNVDVEERPVNEQVTLQHEKVTVERRPVNQTIDANSVPNVQEGTFEVRERAEEAIINKQARVVEEVVINKTEHQHTEQIQDTVRRTDVDVQEIPGETRTTGWTETNRTSSSDMSGTMGSTGDLSSRSVGGQDEGMIERGLSKAENAAERGLNTDLDNDGDVGRRDPRNNI